jgi:hypothetical protein
MDTGMPYSVTDLDVARLGIPIWVNLIDGILRHFALCRIGNTIICNKNWPGPWSLPHSQTPTRVARTALSMRGTLHLTKPVL